MLVSEQKLAVQVAEVNSIEVHNVNLAITGEDEVLEEFAADASCANH